MSDLREALERIRDIAAGRDNLDGFERNRDEKQRRLVACETVAKAAISTKPQPKAVEVDQIQRAMDMLGDVPGNTILERVERIVSYYLALQCELEKVRAVPPLAPDERMRRALRNIAEGNLGDAPGQANYARVKQVALEALSRADDASNASAEARLRGEWFTLQQDGVVYRKEITGANTAKYVVVCRGCSIEDAEFIVNARNALSAGADDGKEPEGCVEGHAQCLTIDRQSSIGFGSCRSSVEAGIKPGPSDPSPAEQRKAKPHDWIKSTLGHGETMCAKCLITNREAAVLGRLNECDAQEGK